jgi:hypothetical protein
MLQKATHCLPAYALYERKFVAAQGLLETTECSPQVGVPASSSLQGLGPVAFVVRTNISFSYIVP